MADADSANDAQSLTHALREVPGLAVAGTLESFVRGEFASDEPERETFWRARVARTTRHSLTLTP